MDGEGPGARCQLSNGRVSNGPGPSSLVDAVDDLTSARSRTPVAESPASDSLPDTDVVHPPGGWLLKQCLAIAGID